MFNPPVMVKFKDFSKPLSIFPVVFKPKLIFKDFSKTVLYIQVLFMPVRTLPFKCMQTKAGNAHEEHVCKII